MKVLWFLPTHGDGRYLGTSDGAREVSYDYLRQIAQAADNLGYYGVLTPTGRSCVKDPWVVTSSLIGVDEESALPRGIASRTGCSRALARVPQRRSTGSPAAACWSTSSPVAIQMSWPATAYSVRMPIATKRRKNSSASGAKSLRISSSESEAYDYEGKHLSVKGAKLLYPPIQRPYPPVWFGGSSAAAHDHAAEHVDTYLTWGEPPAEVAKKVADVKARAAKRGAAVLIRLAWQYCT